jgi:uncharacterized membrane protein YsdA (DUF1294 family)
MNSLNGKEILCWWVVLASLGTFVLFGIDKWLARQSRAHRISEFSLLLVCALGGWPGGLAGIIFFRHKTSKPTFLFRFFGALLIFALLTTGGLRAAGFF